MEEKRHERNKKSRTPKMKIDEKMQQEAPKKDNKNHEKSVPGGWKIESNGEWGCLQRVTQREIEKNKGGV